MTPYSKKMATLDLMLGACPNFHFVPIWETYRIMYDDVSWTNRTVSCSWVMSKDIDQGSHEQLSCCKKASFGTVRGASGTRLLYFNSRITKRMIPKSGVLGGGIHLRLCKDAGSFEIEVKSGRLITYRLNPLTKRLVIRGNCYTNSFVKLFQIECHESAAEN